MNSHNRSINYDTVKDTFDLVRVGDSEMVHQLLTNVSLEPNSLVLDIGCGTANNTMLFQKAVKAKVVGLDLSYGMLLKAVEKKTDLIFTQAPAENLPFKEDAFDFVFMTEVVHHIDDLCSALSEIHKVLKPSCAVCIVTQSHKQIDNRMTTRFFPTTAAVDKARYPCINELEDILSAQGFRDINSKTYEFDPVDFGYKYLETIKMRGFSMLHKISDEAYESGLKELMRALSHGEGLLYSAQYTFVWAMKPIQE